uniref:DNA-binding transcriptional regulator, XRE-family HTH domain n=1 Tax=Candidatus Kentrum sp. LPFa TaxID=2126335 RepID=A0A450WD76_9GAMM|nr:MAG: DNA-binding transcriptional regulator, XRE-family HTH domain [Candidatus Kentron sp. LPFa]
MKDRIRTERKRLRYTQSELAAIGGVSTKTQANYEKGVHEPTGSYLAAIARAGADIGYILTGARDPGIPETPEETRVLAHYRDSPAEVREGVRLILKRTARRSG